MAADLAAMPSQLGQKGLMAMHHDNRVNRPEGSQPGLACGEMLTFPTVPAKRVDASGPKMTALTFQGAEKVAIEEQPRVAITDPTDAIVRITTSTICGSDLHLYHKEFLGLSPGMICGHEAVGIVEEVGPGVTKFKPGDRVVIYAVISCGKCEYCARGETGCCEGTNRGGKKGEMEKMYGHCTAGLFGYSELMGGYEGLQASHARIPLADNNLLNITSSPVTDENAIMLADIYCTAWHANETCGTGPGDTLAVWGCGPIGLLVAYFAKVRGVKRVIAIDSVKYRLDVARDKIGCEVIDAGTQDVVKTIQELVPGGPNKCIDAAAFRYDRGIMHKAMRAVGMETDTPQIANEAIVCCRKVGTVGLIADYYGYTNHFNIGAVMEKSLTLRGCGQLWPQKYGPMLLKMMEEGKISTPWMLTHTMPLSDAVRGYEMFDKKEDNVLKIILKP